MESKVKRDSWKYLENIMESFRQEYVVCVVWNILKFHSYYTIKFQTNLRMCIERIDILSIMNIVKFISRNSYTFPH